jgi:hypothetical protein
MSSIQLKTRWQVNKQENVTHNQEKNQSTEGDSKMTEIIIRQNLKD